MWQSTGVARKTVTVLMHFPPHWWNIHDFYPPVFLMDWRFAFLDSCTSGESSAEAVSTKKWLEFACLEDQQQPQQHEQQGVVGDAGDEELDGDVAEGVAARNDHVTLVKVTAEFVEDAIQLMVQTIVPQIDGITSQSIDKIQKYEPFPQCAIAQANVCSPGVHSLLFRLFPRVALGRW